MIVLLGCMMSDPSWRQDGEDGHLRLEDRPHPGGRGLETGNLYLMKIEKLTKMSKLDS